MTVDFTFQTTKQMIFEAGAAARLAELCGNTLVAPVLFVTDALLIDLGIAAPALEGLEKAGLQPTVFAEVVADPPVDVVIAAVAAGRAAGAKSVVGFGGGSSMDVAKLAAYLLRSDQALDAIYGVNMCQDQRLPLVQVPTTAGTGSEVTPISIITTGENEKKGVVSPQLYADIAVLDGTLTLGVPPHTTAATGVDAMVHAIEAYTTAHKKNPVSDALAREALRLLSRNIRSAVTHGNDITARSNMLLGAMLAGQAFANAPVAAVHALAYPIGGHFHVPHGLSNSLVLPHVLRFNLPAAEQLYGELAPIVFPDAARETNRSEGEILIDGFEELIPELGLQTKLSQVGIAESDVEMMADDAMKQTRLLVNNPREVTRKDAAAIYRAAL